MQMMMKKIEAMKDEKTWVTSSFLRLDIFPSSSPVIAAVNGCSSAACVGPSPTVSAAAGVLAAAGVFRPATQGAAGGLGWR